MFMENTEHKSRNNKYTQTQKTKKKRNEVFVLLNFFLLIVLSFTSSVDDDAAAVVAIVYSSFVLSFFLAAFFFNCFKDPLKCYKRNDMHIFYYVNTGDSYVVDEIIFAPCKTSNRKRK